MAPKRKHIVLSSLGLCTASWLFPTQGHTVFALNEPLPEDSNAVREQIVAEALTRYYSPLATLEHLEPLKQSNKPIKYKIKPGDTLSEIAKQYDLSTERLAAFNRIRDIHTISAGHTLNIPYQVREIRITEGQNLSSLAKKYEVSQALIMKLNPNLTRMKGEVYIGQIVNVPRAMTVSEPPPAKQRHPKEYKNEMQLASRGSKNSKDEETSSVTAATFSGTFAWPVGGQLTSGYGNRNGRLHHGIDIWNEQEANTPIKAAASGVVSRAGYAGNYGNLIVIDHGDGWSTYYAHLSRIQVSKGQHITTGQRIGYMGKTGNATGYHLHFEVRQNGRSLDPLHVLP